MNEADRIARLWDTIHLAARTDQPVIAAVLFLKVTESLQGR